MRPLDKEINHNENHKQRIHIHLQPSSLTTTTASTTATTTITTITPKSRNAILKLKTKKLDFETFFSPPNIVIQPNTTRQKSTVFKRDLEYNSPTYEPEFINLPTSTRSTNAVITTTAATSTIGTLATSRFNTNTNTNNHSVSTAATNRNLINIKPKSLKFARNYGKSTTIIHANYQQHHYLNPYPHHQQQQSVDKVNLLQQQQQSTINQGLNIVNLTSTQNQPIIPKTTNTHNDIPHLRTGSLTYKKPTINTGTTTTYKRPYFNLVIHENFALPSPTNQLNRSKGFMSTKNAALQSRNNTDRDQYQEHQHNHNDDPPIDYKDFIAEVGTTLEKFKDPGIPLSPLETEATNDTETVSKPINSTLVTCPNGQPNDNTTSIVFGTESYKGQKYAKVPKLSDIHHSTLQIQRTKNSLVSPIAGESVSKVKLISINDFSKIEESKINTMTSKGAGRIIEKITEAKEKAKLFNDQVIKQVQFDKDNEEEEEVFLELYNVLSGKIK